MGAICNGVVPMRCGMHQGGQKTNVVRQRLASSEMLLKCPGVVARMVFQELQWRSKTILRMFCFSPKWETTQASENR